MVSAVIRKPHIHLSIKQLVAFYFSRKKKNLQIFLADILWKSANFVWNISGRSDQNLLEFIGQTIFVWGSH